MGLDIYLRKCADLDAAKAAEEAANAEIDALWTAFGGYDAASEAQKEAISAQSEEIAKRHGMTSSHGLHSSIVEFDRKDSQIDPDHMFKVGYFRSGYSEGGIENKLRTLGLPTMTEIFGQTDEYDFKPDWGAALVKVGEAITGYTAHLAGPTGKFSITEVRSLWGFGANDMAEAMKLFEAQITKAAGGFDSYSNSDGHFWTNGLKVRAVITKTFDPSASAGAIGRLLNSPSVFVVYDKETEDGKEDWYLTALKIVRETIEFVLAQPDKQHFYLVWSG